MNKSLKAVEAMLGRGLKGNEKLLYFYTRNDPRYEYFADENGSLAARTIPMVFEYSEVKSTDNLSTLLPFDHETADMRGKIEKR